MTRRENRTLAAPSGATAVRLVRSGGNGAAFHAVIGNCLAQIGGNAAGIIVSQDSEYVHQMRVGLRRLRVALGVFSALAPCPPALQREIDWLAGELGALRDWDVLTETTLPRLALLHPDEAGLESLRQAAADSAAKRRHLLVDAVSSERYTRLLSMLKKWQRGAPKRQAEVSLVHFAGDALRCAYKKLQRRGKHLDDAAMRHRTRIAAKKMRYALEFFASLYPTGKVRRFVKILSRLQDVLGRLNDITVADGLLRQLARRAPNAAGAGFARGALASAAADDVARLDKRIKRLMQTRPPFDT